MARTPVSRTRPLLAPQLFASAALAALLLASVADLTTAATPAPEPRPVTVERVPPPKERLATLRFLSENRDFIRARYDLLREKPRDVAGAGGPLDPRFLAYREMLRDLLADRDSVAAAEDSLQRLQLLASISDLGRLEHELDLMDRLLASQRARLGILQEDFIGRQQTALMVVLSGYPADAPVSRVLITLEDGDTVSVELSEELRASLRQGGVVEIFHGFVEPREQAVEVAVAGERWPAGDRGYVSLDPPRDRLTLLRLDLTPVRSGEGAASIEATTWIHDERPHPGDG